MLLLYQSNRLEHLAATLTHLAAAFPPSHPLAAEEILVASQGMRRYLTLFQAEHSGISANRHYSLPAGFSWQLTRQCFPELPTLNPFATPVLRWRILQWLTTRLDALPQTQAALGSYLDDENAPGGDSDLRHAALAGKLADIFDQYLVYRPDWIAAWEQGTLNDLGADEAWQAELWRALAAETTVPHRAQLWQQLFAALPGVADRLPERLWVFGISTLAPVYVNLLQALAEHIDVHLFALNPSQEPWRDMAEPAQLLHTDGVSGHGHPLLASLGKQGRDFFDALIDVGAQAELERGYFEANTPATTLLTRLQNDILKLCPPEKGCLPQPDDSIQIHCAHSPLRELQILKDRLLLLLAQQPHWQAHDIVVLAPHIETYAPFIEGVFGHASPLALPYSIADTRLSHTSAWYQAALRLLEVFGGRLSLSDVAALAECRAFQAACNTDADSIRTLLTVWENAEVRWGWDAAHRRDVLTQAGKANAAAADTADTADADAVDAPSLPESASHTWQQGLAQTILGWMSPAPEWRAKPQLWRGLAAVETQVEIETQVRLVRAMRILAEHYLVWQTNATAADWVARFQAALAALLQAQTPDDESAAHALLAQLDSWREQTELAGIDTPLSPELAIAEFKQLLHTESEHGFLGGGITFCSMVPMRNLPFRAVCLLGLNDGDFPRDTRAPAFDLAARHPRRGDRARRSDDRYLFLEALLSAREHLYLSYVGRNIKDNQELAPSALLAELVEILATMRGISGQDFWAEHCAVHPLQAFSKSYFLPETALPSHRHDYAQSWAAPATAPQPFYDSEAALDNLPLHINLAQWQTFWRHPVRAWLSRQLGWHKLWRDAPPPEDESFTPTSEADILTSLWQARRRDEPVEARLKLIEARELLPPDQLGDWWRDAYARQAALWPNALLADALPAQATAWDYDGIRLEALFQHITPAGQRLFFAQRARYTDRISALLSHLLWCAAPTTLFDNVTRTTGAVFGSQTVHLPPLEAHTAQTILQAALVWYRLGQHQPLPLTPKCLWVGAQAWIKAQADPETQSDAQCQSAARAAARNAWHGSKDHAGEKDYAETALVFGTDPEPPVESERFIQLVRWFVPLAALWPSS